MLAQGRASVNLQPSRDRLEAIIPQAERYYGAVKRGPVWDRVAPPRKNLLLVSNGLLAKFGIWQAHRRGTVERLEQLAAERARSVLTERQEERRVTPAQQT